MDAIVVVWRWNVSSGLNIQLIAGNVLVNIKYGLRSHIMQNNAKQASLVVHWSRYWSEEAQKCGMFIGDDKKAVIVRKCVWHHQ